MLIMWIIIGHVLSRDGLTHQLNDINRMDKNTKEEDFYCLKSKNRQA
jgi:hypothetical protein